MFHVMWTNNKRLLLLTLSTLYKQTVQFQSKLILKWHEPIRSNWIMGLLRLLYICASVRVACVAGGEFSGKGKTICKWNQLKCHKINKVAAEASLHLCRFKRLPLAHIVGLLNVHGVVCIGMIKSKDETI